MPKQKSSDVVKAGKKKSPIDPLEGPKLALSGQIVTMNKDRQVIKHGAVYIEGGKIVAVQEVAAAPPAGFESVVVTDSEGTIFPGLIELHNHLSYNILKLWNVPKAYKNRGQWAGIPEYRQLISGPMKQIGQAPGMMAALVRYVECKCLFGGTTTSQGIALFSNMGARRFYRGIVRNVEQTGDPDLPEAGTRIPDVDAKDAQSFLARLAQKKCYLLHLAEGVDDSARKHFTSLEYEPGKWAISESLAGIHCAGLKAPDYDVMADHGASMIWSPLSNHLLYGATADVTSARKSEVRMGLGSDWSPSGSKNLLGELKVAHLVSQEKGALFSDQEIVAMATCNAAAILRWDDHLGSIEAGKCADLLVVQGRPKDAYGALIKATEKSVHLVLINGVARFGTPDLMKAFGVNKVETLKVGGEKRSLYLEQKTEDPDVAAVSFSKAASGLTKALKNLPNPSKAPRAMAAPLAKNAGQQPLTWYLALDELETTGMDLRPHLPIHGHGTMMAAKGQGVDAAPVKLIALDLDPATVVDDESFLPLIGKEKNLPDFLKEGLPKLYH